MGIEALGRTQNVVAAASGQGLRMDIVQGYTFYCVGAFTFTLTSAPTFGGSYVTPGNIIVRTYTNAQSNGTGVWVRVNQTAANTVVVAAGMTSFYVDANSLPDTHKYVKVTGGGGSTIAIAGDLVVQRAPANLPALSA